LYIKIKILLITICLTTGFLSLAQNLKESDSLELALALEKDPQNKVEILNKLTETFITSDPDRALAFAQRAFDIAEEQDLKEAKLTSMINMAEIYWSKTKLKSSLQYATKAKELAKLLGKESDYAEALLIIGKIHSELGDYDKSSGLNFEALKILEQQDDKIGIGKAFSRIGSVFFEQENFDKALEYFLKSLAISREINDQNGIARALNNVAAVYGINQDHKNLDIYLLEAIKLNKQIGERLWEGINYLNFGTSNMEQKHYDSAIFYFHRAETIFKQLNNLPALASVYLRLSNYYSKLNNLDKSLNYALKSYNLGINNNLKKSVYVAAQQLHEIYLEQNDFINSYKYSSIEYKMKDSLNIKKSMTRFSQLELLYEFEKLNQEKKLQQQRKDYIYIIFGSIVIFLFILTIILLAARHRIRAKNTIITKKQLECEIENKNKELTANVMTLMRKNEIQAEIASKLLDIRNEAVKEETKSALKRIAGELHKTTDSEIWEEFEIRFRQVHNDFYDKLIKQFPDLSPSEQRLCAFLRLNMTSKEISELTGQRITTLEIARARIRKKLGITNTQINLISFLSQIN
jgi:tetratricopeptide (TPR) repeat protein